MLRTWLLSFLLAIAATASASAGVIDRSQVESTMLVNGFITIDTNGLVAGHEIDTNANLSPELAAFVNKSMERWRFEPVVVDGRVVRARVPMYLRLVAKPAGDGQYTIRIASTWFGAHTGTNTGTTQAVRGAPTATRMVPPKYPRGAMNRGGKGTVYLRVTFGPDGKVTQAYASQVNLRVLGTPGQMQELRRQFAEASLAAARQWEFAPPTSGEDAGKSEWSVMVPVTYILGRETPPKPGEWDSYVPGPMMGPSGEILPQTAASPDALPDSGVFSAEQGARLLTPPSA
ncbi:energy transducer TonB [Thermomonas sp.]|uniref:energy transducer TonB n=1 Tax=Thermomonas sp. TaxID=1971895 RepID=UPI002C7FB66E|nr:energy transducer TonB [Thermomonas sp.]HRO64076.1 energy transducer TonB [Thermomonas sp.]